MKFSDLEKANRVRCVMERATEQREALRGKFIAGILIANRKDDPAPISLQAGTSGTGTISSIGFPDGLRVILEDALHAWCQGRIDEAQRELVELGVDLVT